MTISFEILSRTNVARYHTDSRQLNVYKRAVFFVTSGTKDAWRKRGRSKCH